MGSVTIGSNISSLIAQRQLGKSTDLLNKSSERLASGMRINSASDDAAGLAIASSLNSSARVFTQGIRNVNDGISALSIAEGALGQLSEITTRLMELAEQSANGTFSLRQRTSMASEADQLTNEYNRIVSTTKFNGISLIDPATGEIRIQAGYGIDGSIAIQTTTSLSRTAGDGTFGPMTSYAEVFRGQAIADLNNDGKLDIVVGADNGTPAASVYLGNGDGTFNAAVSYATGASQNGFYSTLLTSDYNSDGKVDLLHNNNADGTISVLLGNGDGTFKAQLSYSVSGVVPISLVQGDYNRDGVVDIVASSNSSSQVRMFFGNSDGSFKASVGITLSTATYSLASADIDNDGILDLIAGRTALHVLKGNGDGTFKLLGSPAVNSALETWVEALDLNRDGSLDLVTVDNNGGGGTTISVYSGNGDGTFRGPTSYFIGTGPYTLATGDLNGDGLTDLLVKTAAAGAQTMLGNGDGTFYYGVTTAGLTGFSIKLADFNSDGVLDESGGGGILHVSLGNTRQVTTLPFLNLLSEQDARSTLTILQENLSRISLQLGSIGAAQSRLAVAGRTLASSHEQYKAAESRILDVDVAEEAATYARTQILQQASASILAQANQLPALALKLLK